jgi:hypothetical protein
MTASAINDGAPDDHAKHAMFYLLLGPYLIASPQKPYCEKRLVAAGSANRRCNSKSPGHLLLKT